MNNGYGNENAIRVDECQYLVWPLLESMTRCPHLVAGVALSWSLSPFGNVLWSLLQSGTLAEIGQVDASLECGDPVQAWWHMVAQVTYSHLFYLFGHNVSAALIQEICARQNASLPSLPSFQISACQWPASFHLRINVANWLSLKSFQFSSGFWSLQ